MTVAKNFILLDYKGNEISKDRNTSAGMMIWDFFFSYLSTSLYPIKNIQLIDKNTVVIAEESDFTYYMFCKKNNFKKIIFVNYESPLYQKKRQLCSQKIRIDFKISYFPLFKDDEIKNLYYDNIQAKCERKDAVVLIAANKSRGKINGFYGNLANLKAVFKNKSWQWKLNSNLLRREKFILNCSENLTVDLFGDGWYLFLPIYVKKSLNYLGKVESKIHSLKKYKFGIAFENYEEANYHTEKVPELILSGTCPIVPDCFKNNFIVPKGLYCTESEFLKDRMMCWKRFKGQYSKASTLEYLKKFSIESVSSQLIYSGALDFV